MPTSTELVGRCWIATAKPAASWERLVADRDQLGGDRRALARELDLVRFQAEEIARAGFAPGDDQELEVRANRLRNAEALTLHLSEARDGSRVRDRRAGRCGRRHPPRPPPRSRSWTSWSGRPRWHRSRCRSSVASCGWPSSRSSSDPEQQALVEARLTLLGDLRRKYGSDLEEVLAFGKAAAERAGELAGLLERAATIDCRPGPLSLNELEETARLLTAARQEGRVEADEVGGRSTCSSWASPIRF